MDKLLKIMTVVSFGTSLFVLGGAGYLYFNMDNIKEAAKEAAIGAAAGAIGTPSLPPMTDGAMPLPSLPSAK
jgi:hypothetical protein